MFVLVRLFFAVLVSMCCRSRVRGLSRVVTASRTFRRMSFIVIFISMRLIFRVRSVIMPMFTFMFMFMFMCAMVVAIVVCIIRIMRWMDSMYPPYRVHRNQNRFIPRAAVSRQHTDNGVGDVIVRVRAFCSPPDHESG